MSLSELLKICGESVSRHCAVYKAQNGKIAAQDLHITKKIK